MNSYVELMNDHQKRVNALPVMYAFNQQQFNEGMERLGLAPADTDKIVSIGMGGFIRKTDKDLYINTFKQIDQEMKDAIAADKDGTGFIKEMFRYELANHEYCITYDLEPTLDALGLTVDMVNDSPALLNGLHIAKREYLAEAEANGWA